MHTRSSRLAFVIALAVAAAGCSGSAGDAGARGPKGDPGDTGLPGTDATAPVVVDNNDVAVAGANGAAKPTATVSGTTATIAFSVSVRGIARDDFTELAQIVRAHNEDAWWVYDVTTTAGSRTKISSSSIAIASTGNGNYTATVSNLSGAALLPGATFMISAMTLDKYMTATVVATVGTPTHDAVPDEACIACHGNHIWRGAAHDVTNPVGVGPCVVCHNRTGSADPRLPGAGTGLMGIVHGVHNSKNMPDGKFTWTWASNGNQFDFSVGFPSYMQNCSVCHSGTDASGVSRVSKVKDAPFSYALCISCHDDFSGFSFGGDAGTKASHVAFTTSQKCTGCHDPASDTVSTRHNGSETERAGIIYDGEDLSVKYGQRVKVEITGVSLEPGTSVSTLVVKWTTQYDAAGTGAFAAVNPCNADLAAGPIFFGATANATTGQIDSTTRLTRAYAFPGADDWVANTSTAAPGQPKSGTKLTTSNTTCAANVATTKVPVEKLDVAFAAGKIAKGLVAIEGVPQIRFDPFVGTSTEVVLIRAKTPTREFRVSSGALPAPIDKRRTVVSVDLCNKCHVGSLYFHGESRVDSIEMCTMCHNAASNEKNNRLEYYGIDVSDVNNTYDFKKGQTYDLRTMIHAIHSAGETDIPIVFYRTRGIYFFGSKAALTAPGVNWPDPTGATTTTTVKGSTVSQTHNFIEVHYPRPVYECGACHVNDSQKRLPDPLKVVAVTDEDAGASTNATDLSWINGKDDTLLGPVEASCMSCHRSAGWTGAWQASHAGEYGWRGGPTANGRQDFIDGNAGEFCAMCHGEGRSADVAGLHR